MSRNTSDPPPWGVGQGQLGPPPGVGEGLRWRLGAWWGPDLGRLVGGGGLQSSGSLKDTLDAEMPMTRGTQNWAYRLGFQDTGCFRWWSGQTAGRPEFPGSSELGSWTPGPPGGAVL